MGVCLEIWVCVWGYGCVWEIWGVWGGYGVWGGSNSRKFSFFSFLFLKEKYLHIFSYCAFKKQGFKTETYKSRSLLYCLGKQKKDVTK